MRRILRPIAHGLRSALGIHGISSRLNAIEQRLGAFGMKLDAARQMAVEPQDSQQLEQCDTDPTKLDYASLFGNPPIPSEPPTSVKQGSRLCQQGDLATDGYRYWMSRMREPLSLNRKMWEWFFIADALFQRGKLAPGHRGIAFGVGLEPLSSLFAAFGAQVLATDMAEDGAATAGWIGQHAASLQALNQRGLCDDASFREKVNFRVLDMNDLPRDLEAGFDFCWSSCALEHIGSLEHGMRFVERAMDLLRPGGVAVHTTEFNMSSNDQTFESAGLSLYRRRDLDALFLRLQGLGYRVEPINWDEGSGFADGHIDLPPYYFTKVHLRLEVASYICTSIGFIVWKQ